MKTTILKTTMVVVAMTVSGLGAWRVYDNYGTKGSSLIVENIEALTNPDNDPWADCPRDKYIRNAAESWEKTQVKYDAKIGYYVSLNGKKISVGGNVSVGGTVLVPKCEQSAGNCCDKSHLNKSIRYF